MAITMTSSLDIVANHISVIATKKLIDLKELCFIKII